MSHARSALKPSALSVTSHVTVNVSPGFTVFVSELTVTVAPVTAACTIEESCTAGIELMLPAIIASANVLATVFLNFLDTFNTLHNKIFPNS